MRQGRFSWMGLIGTLSLPIAAAAGASAAETAGPTPESAMAAEQALNDALRANDTKALEGLLAEDWMVVTTHGGVGDRAGLLGVLRSGDLKRTTMDLSDVSARVYGNVAVVGSTVQMAGRYYGKDFALPERQTDVLIWKDGAWKSVMTHETEIRDKK
jgi:ketosteroid isomerase-like protein